MGKERLRPRRRSTVDSMAHVKHREESESERDERARSMSVISTTLGRINPSRRTHVRSGSSRGRVQQWTDARNRLPKLPVLPFSGTPGATTRCRSSIRKYPRDKQIGHKMGVPGRSESLVAIGAPKLPRRFPFHVHYLEAQNALELSRSPSQGRRPPLAMDHRPAGAKRGRSRCASVSKPEKLFPACS
jgi:hypothetical protein